MRRNLHLSAMNALQEALLFTSCCPQYPLMLSTRSVHTQTDLAVAMPLPFLRILLAKCRLPARDTGVAFSSSEGRHDCYLVQWFRAETLSRGRG